MYLVENRTRNGRIMINRTNPIYGINQQITSIIPTIIAMTISARI
jgi:hypothetical protein